MMKVVFHLFWLAIILVACSSNDGILSESEMEDIIYDMHVSQNIDEGYGNTKEIELNRITMKQGVLKKYGVTPAQWDSSMTYYCKHTDQLYAIYSNVMEKMQTEIGAEGNSFASGDGVLGDTTNVWNLSRSYLFIPYSPYNRVSFNIDCDTTYHKGDKLSLHLDGQFLYEAGSRDLLVLLAVTFANDSTTSLTRHLNFDGPLDLTFDDSKQLGYKKIRGYIMIANANSSLEGKLHVACVDNIRLIRMHVNPQLLKEKQQKDSIEQARIDSMRNSSMEVQEVREIPQTQITNQPITSIREANEERTNPKPGFADRHQRLRVFRNQSRGGALKELPARN